MSGPGGPLDGVALVDEVASALKRAGAGLPCVPFVAVEDEDIVLTVRVASGSLQAVELLTELRYVADVAAVRAFAAHYDIDAAALDRFINAPADKKEGR